MLTKVSEPNHLPTSNIIQWFREPESSVDSVELVDLERIQDNMV